MKEAQRDPEPSSDARQDQTFLATALLLEHQFSTTPVPVGALVSVTTQYIARHNPSFRTIRLSNAALCRPGGFASTTISAVLLIFLKCHQALIDLPANARGARNGILIGRDSKDGSSVKYLSYADTDDRRQIQIAALFSASCVGGLS